jgi:HEPN domain-containing protein/predicted nucleotidyltransferase
MIATQEMNESIRRVLSQSAANLAGFSLDGAVIFGSFAREAQSKDSDADLLILGEGLPPKRNRRGGQIAQIKSMFPKIPLDILLLTRDEVVSNFRNHNPLFLDIAEEGIVVLDKDDFLKNLILETKTYIQVRGIRKFGEGWAFPVKKGVAVPLSNVTNRDFAEGMHCDARRDYEIGITLAEAGYFDKAVYHFQQSVEKAVKGVLITQGVFQKTHFVGSILDGIIKELDTTEEFKEKLKELTRIAKNIEPEVSLSRYPGIINDVLWLPYKEYSGEDAEGAKDKAGKALKIAGDFLDAWFLAPGA